MVDEVYIHPNYDETQFANDIAVVKLSEPVSPSSDVRFVQLQRNPLPALTPVSIYGWGRTGPTEGQPDYLQKARLRTLRDQDCKARLRESGITATINVICAVSPNQSACSVSTPPPLPPPVRSLCANDHCPRQGDSGGPMISPDGLLSGVASAAQEECPPGGLNIYTKVSDYIDFIEQYAD